MQEQFILKRRLQELIGEGTVTAGLFYTFNFDPKFFENYIMPLLIPSQEFLSNSIANNIIWRKLYKDGRVPPITVYCDQYAKSVESGPMLDYNVVGVSLPSVGKNKGNFHPKQSYLLVRQPSGIESLIVITGSNNISQSGWCENKECIGELQLISNKFFPENLRADIREFIQNIAYYYNPGYSEAEDSILGFLNKRGLTSDTNVRFYNSFQQSFQNFLEESVFYNNDIDEIEIISPYFKSDLELLKYFTDKGIQPKIEAPFKQDFCTLRPVVYNNYKNAGVNWCFPESNRNVHSKIYRFYSSNWIHTFIGSVNFTGPAWQGVPARIKQIYNIECGLLFSEKPFKREYILGKIIKELPRFLPLEDSLENRFADRFDSPNLTFIIDWATSTINWKGKLSTRCTLKLSEGVEIDLSNSQELNLLELPYGKNIMEGLARRTVLEVIETLKDQQLVHYYYPNQLNFEQKPIEFRFSATDILDAWDLLGEQDSELNGWLLTRLEQFTDLAQDESGKLIDQVSAHKSLLNEMARHLYGIIQLEEYLFDDKIFNKSRNHLNTHGNNIRYYLINDNVDTLISYLKDIEKLFQEEKLLKGFYWILLNIILNKFYLQPKLSKYIRQCMEIDKQKREFRNKIDEHIAEMQSKISNLEKIIDVDKKKLKWVLETLNIDYAMFE